MSIEKQDNWRQKLLDLDNLPGDKAYDKTTAWFQLQNRLQPAPRRKKTHWYWAAAAMLVLFGWPLKIKKTAAPATITTIARQEVKKNVSPPQPKINESPALIIFSGRVAQNAPTPKARKHNTHIIVPATDTALSILLTRLQPPAPIAVIAKADSAALAAATAKPVEKLPIVHINELETASPQLATTIEPAHSPWRINHFHRSAASQLLAAQNGNSGIIYIKLPSKN